MSISYYTTLKFSIFEVSFIQEISNIILLLVLSVGIRYLKRGIVGQFQLQELRVKKNEAEINALKAQINPHFLFNTLNNIYATNQIDAEKGSEMIMELSEVMRYHLRFSELQKVSLEDEVQLLHSYIALEKLRLTENCKIYINIAPSKSKLKIAPLLLLPFTENAFKHGTHPTKPCFINFSLVVENDTIIFQIRNSIISNKKIVKTHIGLENTKRRLKLIYNNKFELKISNTEDVFYLKLKLKL
ncbi:sensor histidine kinase [Kordia jejudonensis]|uniref:sensor histidine kinase n=1 Tax=Kordia jejudonensis TaxID=1348245 RepID=UPI00138DD395|nr:histidine kinase [Kordia jejudonensis]